MSERSERYVTSLAARELGRKRWEGVAAEERSRLMRELARLRWGREKKVVRVRRKSAE